MNEPSKATIQAGPEGSEAEAGPKTAEFTGSAQVPTSRSPFERLAGLFRHRNGSSLREDLADALAEGDADGESFSPGERGC